MPMIHDPTRHDPSGFGCMPIIQQANFAFLLGSWGVIQDAGSPCSGAPARSVFNPPLQKMQGSKLLIPFTLKPSGTISELKLSSRISELKLSSPTSELKLSSLISELKLSSRISELKLSGPISELNLSSPVPESKLRSPISESKLSGPI